MKFQLLIFIVAVVSASADDVPKPLSAFLDQHCADCHDADAKKGDLDLTALNFDLHDPDIFQKWQRVFDRAHDGEMPPKKKPQPEAAAMQTFLAALRTELKTSDAARIAARGRVEARRLTRLQYERTVHELLGVNVPLQIYLPEDPARDGFDTVAAGQQVSDHLLAKYLEAADAALDAAFARVLKPAPPYALKLGWREIGNVDSQASRGMEARPGHKDAVAWSSGQAFYGRTPATQVPESGWYRVRLRVSAVNPPNDGRVWCSVRSGKCKAKESTLYWVGSMEATGEPSEPEFTAWIQAGHELEIRPNDSGLKKEKASAGKGKVASDLSGVAVHWIEMERIYPGADAAVRERLFADLKVEPTGASAATIAASPKKTKKVKKKAEKDDEATVAPVSLPLFSVNSSDNEADLKRLVQAFAARAFRRPVQADDVQPYVRLALARIAAGARFEDGVRAAYRGILASPRMLYLEETPGALDDHALASRLSYFLWSAPPDDELRALADAGKLREPGTLRSQVERMMQHAKSAAFIENFTDQWLKLSEIDFTTPDANLYPEFDDTLRAAMLAETRGFFHELLARDLSAANILDSDFTLLNSRLARHYQLPWPGGTGMHRVSLQPEHQRGGFISQASVLKVTANGANTSPVIRGVWMMERIMGQHIPPPPANVPALEPDIRGATTVREQLDKHRHNESCSVCHVKIDPPGFALESYDVIGAWRVNYRAAVEAKSDKPGKKGKGGAWKEGPPVDPSYKMADGTTFADVRDFKKLLLQHPDQIARNLTHHLITYSTGAAPSFADRDEVEAILEATKTEHYGVRSLVHQIVQSPLFRNK